MSDLIFVKKFKRQGKQGVVGIAQDKRTKKTYIYKTPQFNSFLSRHEFIVMKTLHRIKNMCPHYCNVHDLICHTVDTNFSRKENLFKIETKQRFNIETILMEYLPYKSLFDCISNYKVCPSILYSTIKMVLIATQIAQEQCEFTHYDLHSCNILMRPCDKDDVFLYKINEDNIVCIPTFGSYPKIIDFGFSYCKGLEKKPIYSSLAHTQVGFLTDQFDPIADAKLFLVTVSDEMKDSRESKILRNIVRNAFSPLSIDWESGWDMYSQPGAANLVCKRLRKHRTSSTLFNKYNEYCIDILQSLIHLPLEPSNDKQLVDSYIVMAEEFSKIEKLISNSAMKLYILKKIIDIARTLRVPYEIKESQESTGLLFKRKVYEMLNKKLKFCNVTKLNCETLLCSMFVFARNVEHILYTCIQDKVNEHNKEYDELPLGSPSELYAAVESNIPSEYIYNSRTRIHFFDCTKNKKYFISQLDPEFITIINEIKYPLMKAECLYDYFNHRHLFKTDTSKRSVQHHPFNFNYSPQQSSTMSEYTDSSSDSI